jgi:hypothetical protein
MIIGMVVCSPIAATAGLLSSRACSRPCLSVPARALACSRSCPCHLGWRDPPLETSRALPLSHTLLLPITFSRPRPAPRPRTKTLARGGAATLGSLIGVLTAVAMGADPDGVYFGLWGYNAALGAITVGGMFYVLDWASLPFAAYCAVMCALTGPTIGTLLSPVGVKAQTFPFCVCALTFYLLQVALQNLQPLTLSAKPCTCTRGLNRKGVAGRDEQHRCRNRPNPNPQTPNRTP